MNDLLRAMGEFVERLEYVSEKRVTNWLRVASLLDRFDTQEDPSTSAYIPEISYFLPTECLLGEFSAWQSGTTGRLCVFPVSSPTTTRPGKLASSVMCNKCSPRCWGFWIGLEVQTLRWSLHVGEARGEGKIQI